MHELDLTLFYALHGLSGKNSFLDALIVFLGQYLIYIVVLGVVLAIAYAWRKERTRTAMGYCAALIAAGIARYGVAELIRHFYHRPRPYVELNISPLFADTAYSFPSGHTIFMFALVAGIFPYNKKAAWWLAGAGLLIGLARVAAGVHYPSDILGGIILGLCTGALVHFLYRSFKVV